MNTPAARYLRPNDLPGALATLAAGPRVVLAGGTDLYATGTPAPAALRGAVLDITAIEALRGIRTEGGELVIGAAVTWAELRAARLPGWMSGLVRAAAEVGAAQIQHVATVAGNLCNASPAADGIPPLLALAARVELSAARGVRTLALADFVQGPRRTRLAPDELVTAVRIPLRSARARSVFCKLGARRYLVISIVALAVTLDFDDHDRISHAGVAVGSCAAAARRLGSLEARLLGLERRRAPQVAPGTLPEIAPIDDIRATAAYRRDALATLVRRALEEACRG